MVIVSADLSVGRVGSVVTVDPGASKVSRAFGTAVISVVVGFFWILYILDGISMLTHSILAELDR